VVGMARKGIYNGIAELGLWSWMRHLEEGHGILGFGKARAFGRDKIFAS
jgi:hypothetical protein